MRRVFCCAGLMSLLPLLGLLAGCSDSGPTTQQQPLPVGQTAPPTQSTGHSGTTPAPPAAPAVTTTFASVPAAIEVMKSSAAESNNDQLRAVGEWLANQGPGAIGPLVAVMDDQSLGDRERLAACRILGDMGAAARDALHAAAQSDNMYVQQKAIESLGKIRPVEDETVQVLIVLLDSENEMVLRHTIAALGNIGEPAAIAAERLQSMYNDHSLSDSVRGQAHDALKKVDPRRDFQGLG